MLLATLPVSGMIPALGQLALVAPLVTATLVAEAQLFAADRRKVRSELARH